MAADAHLRPPVLQATILVNRLAAMRLRLQFASARAGIVHRPQTSPVVMRSAIIVASAIRVCQHGTIAWPCPISQFGAAIDARQTGAKHFMRRRVSPEPIRRQNAVVFLRRHERVVGAVGGAGNEEEKVDDGHDEEACHSELRATARPRGHAEAARPQDQQQFGANAADKAHAEQGRRQYCWDLPPNGCAKARNEEKHRELRKFVWLQVPSRRQALPRIFAHGVDHGATKALNASTYEVGADGKGHRGGCRTCPRGAGGSGVRSWPVSSTTEDHV
mmetsp:Transcript_70106/g.194955  ORF Transcript_70106/g.194955 Transcript_70106/m.194955 type:complete len:275 (-) Transcript_70106:167-991(-)